MLHATFAHTLIPFSSRFLWSMMLGSGGCLMKVTMRSLITTTLVLALSATPALASDLMASATKAATEAAQTQRPAARGQNPYKTPGIILLSAGAGLTLLAFLAPSGVSCQETGRGLFDVSCGTTTNKGLLFGGLGAMGVGGFLLMKKPSPSIQFGPGHVGVTHRIAF